MTTTTASNLTLEIMADLEAEKARALEMLDNVTRYLTSRKFSCGSELDGYVNISDVLPAIREAASILRG